MAGKRIDSRQASALFIISTRPSTFFFFVSLSHPVMSIDFASHKEKEKEVLSLCIGWGNLMGNRSQFLAKKKRERGKKKKTKMETKCLRTRGGRCIDLPLGASCPPPPICLLLARSRGGGGGGG